MAPNPSTTPVLPYPIALRPASKLDYFDRPQPFNIITLMQQNKMILMMVGMAIFAVGMPKLLVSISES